MPEARRPQAEPPSSLATYPSLRDRRVVISGGANGIGAAMVAAFAEQGAQVAFLDVDTASALALIQQLDGCRHRPLFRCCDLQDLEALRSTLTELATAIGALQVLINNAARDDRHQLEDVTPELWDELIGVNLRHQFFASQAVLPAMRDAGSGVIINLGSITFLKGFADLPVYVTAKGGVVGLTRALAREWGAHGVRVNCIIPGWVLTERQQRLWLTPEADAERRRTQSLKDWILPEDVARLALFLASDDSRMCTGQNFVIDGGR
ncbi:SDR family NAD(P)-dependent oxidoreductase [Synechococcus sp. EJ6-Ellesmere]|uniref:SDR family NAD(P)-dependent oxidoreductase n=1 Tax=Synechococcus sp. EJ6-Ellesmere TaxID=2823734 RepID=UPI0020CCB592|nr:SDR family oxidoreductase [Synechococcus sp. EJ6-Ellesmere]MCP9824570.1 SDR family oxidoreductase [Synechococcus sp. EJ6-Ellesmere]